MKNVYLLVLLSSLASAPIFAKPTEHQAYIQKIDLLVYSITQSACTDSTNLHKSARALQEWAIYCQANPNPALQPQERERMVQYCQAIKNKAGFFGLSQKSVYRDVQERVKTILETQTPENNVK